MDSNKIFGLFLFAVIVIVVIILLAWCLGKNIWKRKQKKNGQVIEAEILSWKAIMGQPTRYAFKLTYRVGDESIVKTLITSGRFAKKYEHKDRVQIVIFPKNQKVCFQEETWLGQNICLTIALTALLSVIAGLGFLAVAGTLAFSEAGSVPVKYAVKAEAYF